MSLFLTGGENEGFLANGNKHDLKTEFKRHLKKSSNKTPVLYTGNLILGRIYTKKQWA